MAYKTIIGLEIHIELKTKSKMFCSCKADIFGSFPNSHCCPVCLGLPGALPVPNQEAIKMVVLTGLALGGKIANLSKFDRKNYFYPDLPKGYQISQYDIPLVTGGLLDEVKIRRIHLEEDTAKMFHHPSDDLSLIDFNRSGIPLMEIVTEPVIKNDIQARNFLKHLQQIIRSLGISDCDMEKGSMRLEANISLSSTNDLPNYKVEVKNLNSFRFVGKAIKYEEERQSLILDQGKQPLQETRGWDDIKQQTYSQRVKEEAQDYRYFPEPDIPPLKINPLQIEEYQNIIDRCELPEAKISRLQKDFQISLEYALLFSQNQEMLNFFEKAVNLAPDIKPKQIANQIINHKIDFKNITPLDLITKIRQNMDKKELELPFIKTYINEVIKENPQAVTDYRAGKKAVIGFLIGKVMAKSQGRTSADSIGHLLEEELNLHG